jgi:hypothetical protein
VAVTVAPPDLSAPTCRSGMVTAEPVCSTTIVFGLAAATEEISWFR